MTRFSRDIEGEVFDDAGDSASDCLSLTQFNRAGTVIILVDGKKICAKSSTRQSEFDSAKTLLRALLDLGMIDSGVNVDILVTKADLLSADDKAFANNKLAGFLSAFSNKLPKLRIAIIAPRPRQRASSVCVMG